MRGVDRRECRPPIHGGEPARIAVREHLERLPAAPRDVREQLHPVLADRAAQFATAAREAVASGVAVSSPAAFAAELRRAGDLLARSSAGDEEALAIELDAITAAVQTIQPGAAPPRSPGPVRPA